MSKRTTNLTLRVNLRTMRRHERKGIHMRSIKSFCFAASAFMVASAFAAETTVVSDVLGAEGPLYVDGNLYYVGWVSNTLSKWDGKAAIVLNKTPGCGHNGLEIGRA